MIGVFDSGVGGLTVVKEIFKHLPEYQLIYFGDTARLPYGTKGADFVQRYSSKIAHWLAGKGAEVIVVACHTSSAWAADSLKKEFSHLPVFEMIAPGVREAARTTKNGRIGIIGTPGTIRSGSYAKKLQELDSKLQVFSQACPLFVPLVEEGWVTGLIAREIAEKYLKPLKQKKVDTIVLACTHYPLLTKLITQVMGRKVKIVNPAESLAKELKEYLDKTDAVKEKMRNGNDHRFFFSDEPYNFKKISHLCFKRHVDIEVKDPF